MTWCTYWHLRQIMCYLTAGILCGILCLQWWGCRRLSGNICRISLNSSESKVLGKSHLITESWDTLAKLLVAPLRQDASFLPWLMVFSNHSSHLSIYPSLYCAILTSTLCKVNATSCSPWILMKRTYLTGVWLARHKLFSENPAGFVTFKYLYEHIIPLSLRSLIDTN